MSKEILVLSGSPRGNGNTQKLAAAFVEGAQSAGHSVTLFRVADLKVAGCLGCGYCFGNKGVCIQKDDMEQIHAAIRQSEVLVFASPVYFFSLSAQLKCVIDRTYALLSEELPVRRTALLLAAGGDAREDAAGALAMYQQMCAFLKWEDAGVVLCGGLQERDAVIGRVELEEARALGRDI